MLTVETVFCPRAEEFKYASIMCNLYLIEIQDLVQVKKMTGEKGNARNSVLCSQYS
jgi:hypothetical protein